MKKNYSNGLELPIGLGMAMAQNPDAYSHFAGLSPELKQQVINTAHNITSRSQMQELVSHIAHDEVCDMQGQNGFF